jgi:hypothetical protein
VLETVFVSAVPGGKAWFAPRFGAEPAGEIFTTKFSLKYETLPVANELLTAG